MDMLPITASLDPALRAGLDVIAAERGLTSADYAAEAIRRAVQRDLDDRAFVQEGIDAADRGELIPQAEMERWFEARIAERQRG